MSADLVVLNKADLVGPDRLDALRAEIAGTLPRAVKIAPAREGVIDADVLLGMRAAAEDDLNARPSHHDAEGEHDHDDFDTFVVAIPAVRRSRRASSTASSRRRARMTSCGSRASSKSPASRCGCWCKGVGQRFRRDFERPWGANEARQSRLVVIAQRGVDRDGRRGGARRLTSFEPCTSRASRSGRSTRQSKRSISARLRPTWCFSRFPTAISTRSRAPTRPSRSRGRR